jgi:transcriptional regulator with XRE-family HTH domain
MHFYLFGLDFLCVLQYNKREVIIMYGQNIRLFRKQKGMNQHELGAAMDVSAVSVSKWEREQTQPDIETLQKLADLFDTSIDELCGRPPKPESCAALSAR